MDGLSHMKWWGWGDDGISFTHDDKPELAPFVKDKIGIDLNGGSATVMDFDELDVVAPVLTDELRHALEEAVGEKNVSTDAMDRVTHTYGKSLRDLVRVRRGDLGRLPDVIVFPGSEHEVTTLFEAAMAADAVIIPFGGGTNISGSLEAPRGETRTRDLRRPRPDEHRDRDRRGVGPRPHPGRRARAVARGAAQRPRASPSGTSPTASRTRRWAGGSRPARRACSPTSTATSPTSPAPCAS